MLLCEEFRPTDVYSVCQNKATFVFAHTKPGGLDYTVVWEFQNTDVCLVCGIRQASSLLTRSLLFCAVVSERGEVRNTECLCSLRTAVTAFSYCHHGSLSALNVLLRTALLLPFGKSLSP